MYKVIDIFGNEDLLLPSGGKKPKNLFSDYDSFVDKFEAKKTTDDCYTPEAVFKVVLDHVGQFYNLEGKQILRPFYPGGDFEAIDYPVNCVVIDNPPFSIISKIAKFYVFKKIPFFLFAPHLTLFSADLDCTYIVCGTEIIYENGAKVKTSFLSNLFGDAKIIGDAELHNRIKEAQKVNKPVLPLYKYPPQVATVSSISFFVEKGVSIRIDKQHTKHCRALASQKSKGKTIFGSGFLLSEQAAKEQAAKEQAAKEQAAKEINPVVVWKLSEREKQIIKSLGRE